MKVRQLLPLAVAVVVVTLGISGPVAAMAHGDVVGEDSQMGPDQGVSEVGDVGSVGAVTDQDEPDELSDDEHEAERDAEENRDEFEFDEDAEDDPDEFEFDEDTEDDVDGFELGEDTAENQEESDGLDPFGDDEENERSTEDERDDSDEVIGHEEAAAQENDEEDHGVVEPDDASERDALDVPDGSDHSAEQGAGEAERTGAEPSERDAGNAEVGVCMIGTSSPCNGSAWTDSPGGPSVSLGAADGSSGGLDVVDDRQDHVSLFDDDSE